MLSVSGESVWGSVMVNGDQWQIQALGDGVHAISHLDLTKAPQANQRITDRIHVRNTGSAIVSEDGRSAPFMPHDFSETLGYVGDPALDVEVYVSQTIENIPPDVSFCRFSYFGCPIRILVLYTDLAASEVASISDIATAGRNELAMASGRSRTGGSYEIANIVRIPFVEGLEVGDPDFRLDADLAALKGQYYPLLDQYRADLMVVLTGAVYGNYSGSVQELRVASDNAHAIVVAKWALSSQGGQYTFAHEVGHLMGAQHDLFHAAPQVNYPYEYGYRFSYKPSIFLPRRFWRTVMAYNPHVFESDYGRNYTQIANFSNPNVIHDSRPTGTSLHYNAKVLENHNYIIHNYRPDPLRALIHGPSYVLPGVSTQWAAIISKQPTGSTRWLWSVLPSGQQTFVPISEASVAQYTLPPGVSGALLRLRVTHQGDQVETYLYLNASTGGGLLAAVEQAEDRDENAVGEDSNLVVGFSVDGPSPNPVRDRSSLQVDIASEGEIEIIIFDMLGRQVALTDAHYGSGRHTIPLSVSSLPAGRYIVRVTSNGNGSATRQITVVR